MALVRRLERSSKERNAIHEEVNCTYTDFADPKTGSRFLQLDTFGREGAAQLRQIIEQVFGL